MFYRGPKSSLSRVNAYSAKVRAYTGTGTAPDYVSPVCQFKLSEMYRKFQQVADDQHSYQARVFVTLGDAAANSITYGPTLPSRQRYTAPAAGSLATRFVPRLRFCSPSGRPEGLIRPFSRQSGPTCLGS